MPFQYWCQFTIPGGSMGGRLSGGFPNNVPPTLQKDDSIVVSVTCDVSVAPNGLTGVFIYTAAGDAPSNQSTPSPFVTGANRNFVCIETCPGTVSGDSGSVTFTFPAWGYGGGQPGSYELTFVAWNQTTGLQWSEDPEFETGN